MKKSILLGFVSLIACTTTFAAEQSVSTKAPIVVVAPESWKVSKDDSAPPGFPFEAYRIAPTDERNTACLVSFIKKGGAELTDPAFLKQVTRGMSRPFVSSAEELAKVEIKELKVKGAVAYHARFIDPDLVGKPVQKGNYKTVTVVLLCLESKYLLTISVFCDELDGADCREAMKCIEGLRLKSDTVRLEPGVWDGEQRNSREEAQKAQNAAQI